MPTTRVNDIDMYYEIHGVGDPVVLIMGLSTDISEWEFLVTWLATSHQVLAFDNRGAGRTDKPDAPYSIAVMAGDTAGLMQELGFAQASVIGISMGGKVALELALRYPRNVARLILVGTSPRAWSSRTRTRVRALGLLSALPPLRSKYQQPRHAFRRQLQASAGFECTERLHELRIPTVIMHGLKDRTAPFALAREMQVGIAGSRMITFKGGHLFPLMGERQAFLDELSASLPAPNVERS